MSYSSPGQEESDFLKFLNSTIPPKKKEKVQPKPKFGRHQVWHPPNPRAGKILKFDLGRAFVTSFPIIKFLEIPVDPNAPKGPKHEADSEAIVNSYVKPIQGYYAKGGYIDERPKPFFAIGDVTKFGIVRQVHKRYSLKNGVRVVVGFYYWVKFPDSSTSVLYLEEYLKDLIGDDNQ